MPTGYTALIGEGKQTTKEYIMNCARAFCMRDESSSTPIPEFFVPDDYHVNKLNELQLNLNELYSMAEEVIQIHIDILHQKKIDNRNKYILEKLAIKDRYESALHEIKKWDIPSPEHKNLKEFCISQLEYSIKWDCNMNYIETIPKKESISEWRLSEEKRLKDDINYHKERYNEEVIRANERNVWVYQLRNSLNNF